LLIPTKTVNNNDIGNNIIFKSIFTSRTYNHQCFTNYNIRTTILQPRFYCLLKKTAATSTIEH
jgi:hypothetical protein